MKKRKRKDCILYRGYKFFLSEDEFEVMRVNCGVVSISLFRINIPLFSKSIWFSAKITRAKSDNKIKL